MPTRKLKKPAEGSQKPVTADMVAWKKEFDEIPQEEHLAKLKVLGLDDSELEEFKEMEEGAPVEDEIMQEGPLGKEEEPAKKKTVKKKAVKKK